ncbi:hypothetical protein ACHAQK_001132 [Fusarium lateritium]
MALCQICASLDLASIIRMKAIEGLRFLKGYPQSENILCWIPAHDESQRTEASLVPYHETVADLIKNADICNLCQVVYRSITPTVDLLEKITQPTPIVSLVLTHRVFLCSLEPYQGLRIISYDDNQDPSTAVYQLLGGVGFLKDTGEFMVDTLSFVEYLFPGLSDSRNRGSAQVAFLQDSRVASIHWDCEIH